MRMSDWSSDVCSADLKIPRFAFEKFPAADARLTTQMKSVGEVMAIGRTFQESMQKALRGLETGRSGFDPSGVDIARSEERRVGKECVRTCRSRWSTYH